MFRGHWAVVGDENPGHAQQDIVSIGKTIMSRQQQPSSAHIISILNQFLEDGETGAIPLSKQDLDVLDRRLG